MLGIFDSGSGGLSVASEIINMLPQCDVVYIGDTKNMPYGNKSSRELFSLTQNLIEFLMTQKCTTVVSACNSISSQVILNKLFHHKIPIIEMVRPTISHLHTCAHKKIALVATPATIASGMYHTEFLAHHQSVHQIANAHLAAAIETNNLPIIHREIHGILEECKKNDIEMLSLSCTHYPLVKNLFETEAENQQHAIEIFDPSYAVAQEVARTVANVGTGSFHAYTTQKIPQFISLLKQKIPHATHEVISL